MRILVTGAAGFIGYHLCKLLLERNYDVVGLDNLNSYYDVNLKYSRLGELGMHNCDSFEYGKKYWGNKHGSKFAFTRIDLQDKDALPNLFKDDAYDVVFNLAAQAGVRYSLENPQAYMDSNINGFLNILECCRNSKVKHLIYASSSSVYGLNDKTPFSIDDNTDQPISLYAASKKSNELMAHTYSHLFDLPTTGLRFFTVYGPWGRPDMALFLFTDSIVKGKSLKVFNSGKMMRDFTFVDDISEGLLKILEKGVDNRQDPKDLFKLYNMGNNKSVKLMDFIESIAQNLGLKANLDLLPMQPGDVRKTWANVDGLIQDYQYFPNTKIEDGVAAYVQWYKSYYGKIK